MAIQNVSDSQKVDYLWKKIVYGAAKTDIAGNIDATQEPYSSPLQIRADKIMYNSDQIPGVIPVSNSSVVTVYPTSFPIQCTSDAGIPTPTLTWTTGVTYWIPPEFGSTYQVKVYIAPTGQAANVTTKGTQVFATGSSNNDQWVFDYQAGILQFNGNNTPYSGASPISFTGNSVYISGAVYSGQFGLGAITGIVGNLIIANTSISSNGNLTLSTITSGNVYINAAGTGTVQILGNDALGIPVGNILNRPTNVGAGYIRYNSELNVFEYYTGTSWVNDAPATMTSQIINPNGLANTFTLLSNTTTAGAIVSINGTLQQPTTAYNITNNNQIIFSEIPLSSDIVEVRSFAGAVTSISSLSYNQTKIVLDSANVNITGNVLPSANVTYSLGSADYQWKDLWLSSNTLYIGGSAVTITAGQLSIAGNIVTGAVPFGNVNVKAYTETMTFTNYSNVNVTAYLAGNVTTRNISSDNVNAARDIVVGGNVTISGNLSVAGNTTFVNTIVSTVALPNLLVVGSSLTFSAFNANLQYGGNQNNYFQFVMQNANNGSAASTDLVATADNGNESDTYIDMGINSSTYNQAGFTLTKPNDGYLYVQGNLTTGGGNLILATMNNNDIIFATGGQNTANEAARFSKNSASFIVKGNIIGGNVRQTTSSTVPSVASVGDQWYDTSTDIKFQYTYDGTNYVWVDISSAAMNTNVAIVQGTSLSITGNGTVGGTFTVGGVLALNSNNSTVAILNAGTSGVGNIGSVSTTFNTIFAKATTAQYADLAEKYTSDYSYAPGTVLVFGGDQEVTVSNISHDPTIAGVVSTEPAYLMNNGIDGVAIALTGRVPVMVKGPVNKGERLVASNIPGVAVRLDMALYTPGCVLGKSLEILTTDETKLIEVSIGRF